MDLQDFHDFFGKSVSSKGTMFLDGRFVDGRRTAWVEAAEELPRAVEGTWLKEDLLHLELLLLPAKYCKCVH